METREFPLFLFRLKKGGGIVHVEEKSKITRRLSSEKRERERVSLLGDHLAGRQIPARLTFSSKNEKKKEKRQRYFARPGLVFRTRHYHSVFLSFSYNPRPVFVPHVSSRSDVAIVPSWRANGIMNRASCYEVTLAWHLQTPRWIWYLI